MLLVKEWSVSLYWSVHCESPLVRKGYTLHIPKWKVQRRLKENNRKSTTHSHFYHPQTKCLSFCPQGGGVCHTPGQTPPWTDTLLVRHPQADIPPGRHPLGSACWDTHTPCPVLAGIRSTSGRYASHWDAFLFKTNCCLKLSLPILSRRQSQYIKVEGGIPKCKITGYLDADRHFRDRS